MRRALPCAGDGQRAVLLLPQNEVLIVLPALGIKGQPVELGILLSGRTLRAIELQFLAASKERAAADLRNAVRNIHALERRAFGEAARS